MTSTRMMGAVVLAAACGTLWPASADAQVRATVRVGPRPAIVAGYGAFYYYDPWFPYAYGWYRPYAFPPPYYDNDAALRLQITPKQAEVYIDGYYAGAVDDFDGAFQRLRLDPGEHELTVYLDGYRTFRQNILLQPGNTFTARQTLEPLRPGDVQEPRPSASSASAAAPRAPRDGRAERRPPRGGQRAPAANDNASGSIALRVQPANAEVFIDGERWDGPSDNERLTIQLSSGTHRLEIRRDGYRTYDGSITVTPGQTTTLNVSLSR